MNQGKLPLRVAVFGTGYWSQFQIAAWQSVGASITAVWNRTGETAVRTAAKFGIPRVFKTPEEVFEGASFDIADIITGVEAHDGLVRMAAAHGKAVICQKPMADDLGTCEGMVAACRNAGVWYAIHENFRYQPAFTIVKETLQDSGLGKPLHAHVQMKSPDRDVLGKQPALTRMDHMALRDMGPHIFDVVRYLFGNARSVYSRPVVSYGDIGVQDSAVSLVVMESGLPVLCTLAHNFTYKIFLQCQNGTLILDRANVLHVHLGGNVRTLDTRTCWTMPDFVPEDDLAIHGGHVFAAIPLCLQSLKDRYLQGNPAETSGEDNLETMRLVFAAIRSQDSDTIVSL